MNRRISKNVILTLANTVFSGVLLYFLYQYLLRQIGVHNIGVWSVVVATTSFGRVGGMGISGSVIKFVAKYRAWGDSEAMCAVIETGAISIGILVAALLVVAYFPLTLLLHSLVPGDAASTAVHLLPFAMFTLWFSTLGGVFQAGLEGVHRFDIPALSNMGVGVLYLALVVSWVPANGLDGVVYAQLAQAISLMVVLWWLLRANVPGLSRVPMRWSKPHFFEMLRYGVNFQAGSLLQLLLDPVTKLLMARFGGLGMVGYFEMANRMVVQFRALLVSANRVLIPVIAEHKEKSPEQLKRIYIQSFRLLVYLAVPLYLGVAALAPAIADLWIGHVEPSFVWFTLLLSAGWFVNTLVGPSYMGNLGSGDLKLNTIYHAVNGLLNLVLGGVFGLLGGGMGVAVGYVLSIVIASLLLLTRYQRENRIPAGELRLLENVPLVLLGFMGAVMSWLAFQWLHSGLGKLVVLVICMGVAGTLMAMAAWWHPLRQQVAGRFRLRASSA